MAYEMRPGSGSLFKNDKKETDRHPSLKGRVMLPNGEVRWLSAWTKKTSAGESWISLSVGELVQQPGGSNQVSAHSQAKANGYAPSAGVADLDDDIPF
jgi:hypothetical protein